MTGIHQMIIKQPHKYCILEITEYYKIQKGHLALIKQNKNEFPCC